MGDGINVRRILTRCDSSDTRRHKVIIGAQNSTGSGARAAEKLLGMAPRRCENVRMLVFPWDGTATVASVHGPGDRSDLLADVVPEFLHDRVSSVHGVAARDHEGDAVESLVSPVDLAFDEPLRQGRRRPVQGLREILAPAQYFAASFAPSAARRRPRRPLRGILRVGGKLGGGPTCGSRASGFQKRRAAAPGRELV